ncbi:hypothetical protein PGIGA_G00170850 [Pangasianodon gigas]|uniref:Uncharacterized protein n=1 Tax=Pangasianodon gigas TaxID=30993 RepID=A0ACC5XUS0_PANGG|nr:hypothetical protein [Pangasianodon gigas]
MRENFSRDDSSPHFSNSMTPWPFTRASLARREVCNRRFTECSPVPVCVEVVAVCGANFSYLLHADQSAERRARGRHRAISCTSSEPH